MVIVAQLREYPKIYWIAYFRRVNFMVCELYLNKAIILKKKYMIYSKKEKKKKKPNLVYI